MKMACVYSMVAANSSSLASRLRRLSRNPDEVAGRALNRLFSRAAGGDSRPVFHDIDKTCPFAAAAGHKFYSYSGGDGISSSLQGPNPTLSRHYRERTLYLRHYRSRQGLGKYSCFTEQTKVSVPGLLRPHRLVFPTFSKHSLSILDPGKSEFPLTAGPYLRLLLRYHLGLRVPQNRPPSIRIKDQYYTWKEGQSIIFDDRLEQHQRSITKVTTCVLF